MPTLHHPLTPPRFFHSSYFGGNKLHKKVILGKEIGNITRRGCYPGRKIDASFLREIPPTLIFTRELSNKHIVPIGSILKKNFKKTNIDNKGLVLITKWIKKPRLKRFKHKLFSDLHQNREEVQNEFKLEYTVSKPKFNLTSLLNKRSNSIAENTEKKDLYKAILSKLCMSPSHTKNSLIRKKNINYDYSTSNKTPEQTGTSKQSIENNESGIRTGAIIQEKEVTTESGNKKTEEILQNKEETTDSVENSSSMPHVISTEPSTISDNTLNKSKSVDLENVIKKPDDRSRIRKNKKQNLINEDKQNLKAKAKQFEKLYKPEVDFYIKKLAAKYGKTTIAKNSKPKRSYDNNRQRIKYELNNYTADEEATKYEVTKRIGRNPLEYKQKGFHEFIKTEVEKIKSLNRRSSDEMKHGLNGSARILAKEKLKRGTILRKDNLQRQLKAVHEGYKKRNNAEIKLNLSNGLLSGKGINFKITDKLVGTNGPKNSTIGNSSDDKKIEDMGKFTDKNQQNACLNDDQNEKQSQTTATVLKTDLEHFSKNIDNIQTSKHSESIQLKKTLEGCLQNKSINRLEQHDKLQTNIVAEINKRSSNQYSPSYNKNTKHRDHNTHRNYQKQEQNVGSLENKFIKENMIVLNEMKILLYKDEKCITSNTHCKEQSKLFKAEQHKPLYPNQINKPENGEVLEKKTNTKIETQGEDLGKQENINMNSFPHKITYLESLSPIEENKASCKLENIGGKEKGLDKINESIAANNNCEVEQGKENDIKEDMCLNDNVNANNKNNTFPDDNFKSSEMIALKSNKTTDKYNEESKPAFKKESFRKETTLNVGDDCTATKNKVIPLMNPITHQKTKTNLILSPAISLEKISKRNMFNVGKENQSENLNQKNLDHKPISRENEKIHLKILRDLPLERKNVMKDIKPHKMGNEPLFSLMSEAIKLEEEKSSTTDPFLIRKKYLNLQHENVKSKKQGKQLAIDSTMQMDVYASKFVDIVINKNIQGEKVRINMLLMHGLNKISFLKDFNEIPFLIAKKPISKKLLKMDSNNDNDQDINTDLENDLSTIVSKQMALYMAEIKKKKLNRTKQKNYLLIDNLFDCSFVLQSFNKVSFNKDFLKNVLCKELAQSDTIKETREILKIISALSETYSNRKFQPLENTSRNNLEATYQVKKRFAVNHKTNDVTFLEILDFCMPMKYMKSAGKESISEDSGAQMNYHMNSKNMSFYSKYRMDVPTEVNILRDKKNIDITKDKVMINRAVPPNQRNCLGDDYNQSNLTRPIQYSTKPNELKGTLVIHFNGQKNSLEKSNIKEIQVNNGCTASKTELIPTKSTTLKTRLMSKENQNRGKIEPEVLHYIQKLEKINLIVPTNKTPSSETSHSMAQVKNSVEGNSNLKDIEKNINCTVQSIDLSSEIDGTLGTELKSVHLEKKKCFEREIPCSTTIKILEKSETKDFDIIKDSQRGNFKYLTREIQNKKKCAKNLSKTQNQSNNEKLHVNIDVNTIPINHEKKVNTIQVAPSLSLTQSNKNLPDELNISSFTSNSINNVRTTYEVHIKTEPTTAETRIDSVDLKGNRSTFPTPRVASRDIEKMTHKNLNDSNTILLDPKTQRKILKNLENNQPLEKNSNSDRRINNNKFTRVQNNTANAACSSNKTVKVEMTKANNDLKNISMPTEYNKNTLTSLKSEECLLNKLHNNVNELHLVDINKNEVHHKKENIKHQFSVKESGTYVENVNTKNKIKESILIPNLNETLSADGKSNNKIIGTQKSIATKRNSTENVTALSLNKSHSLNHELEEEQGMNTSENKLCFEGNSLNKESSENNLKTTINHRCKEDNLKTIKTEHRISDTKNKDKCNVQNILKQKYALSRPKVDNNDADSNESISKKDGKTLQRNNKNNINSYISRIQEILGDSNETSKKSLSSSEKKILKSTLSRDKNTNLCNNLITNINNQKELESDPNTKSDIGVPVHHHLTEHIPSGARCIKQHKDLKNDKDNVQEKIKHSQTNVEKEYQNEAETKDNSFSKEKNINNSVALTITKQLITDSSSGSRFNHKLLLEKITTNKRVTSIKNTLSNNLKPKEEVKIMQKPPCTLMDIINTESGRKRNDENKRDSKQRIEQHRKKLFRMNNIILKAHNAEKKCSDKSILDFQHTHTNRNIANYTGDHVKYDLGSNDITSDYKQCNEFNKRSLMKSGNNGLSFNKAEFTVTENKKEVNDINEISNLTKGVQNNHKENAICVFKQPTTEGFISQTLREPTSAPKLVIQPKLKGMKTNLHTKYRKSIQGNPPDRKKIAPSNSKQKISKHHLSNSDLRMNKKNLKQNYNGTKVNVNNINLNISSHNQIHNPLQGFYNKQKIRPLSKQCILDAPSRQASRLASQRRIPKIKPVLLKEKIDTNWPKCMSPPPAQRLKQEFEKVKKDTESSANFVNVLQSKEHVRDPQYKQTFEEIYLINKTKESQLNCYSSDTANRIPNKENMDLKGDANRINYGSTNDANINEFYPIVNSKNDSFNIDYKCSSTKIEKKSPSLVDIVVNNVKAKLQKLPSSVSKMISPNKIRNNRWLDIVSHKTLLKGSESIKKWQKKINNIQKQIAHTRNPKHSQSEIKKRNDTIVSAIGNGRKKQAMLPYKTPYKIKPKSKNKSRDTFQRRRKITDLLKFKPQGSKKICPQMSYSEVLNKFYISSDYASVK